MIGCQLHVLRAIASQLYKVEIFLTQAGELNNRVEDWMGAVSRCDFLFQSNMLLSHFHSHVSVT